jgi:hypothetical protein
LPNSITEITSRFGETRQSAFHVTTFCLEWDSAVALKGQSIDSETPKIIEQVAAVIERRPSHRTLTPDPEIAHGYIISEVIDFIFPGPYPLKRGPGSADLFFGNHRRNVACHAQLAWLPRNSAIASDEVSMSPNDTMLTRVTSWRMP